MDTALGRKPCIARTTEPNADVMLRPYVETIGGRISRCPFTMADGEEPLRVKPPKSNGPKSTRESAANGEVSDDFDAAGAAPDSDANTKRRATDPGSALDSRPAPLSPELVTTANKNIRTITHASHCSFLYSCSDHVKSVTYLKCKMAWLGGTTGLLSGRLLAA